MAVVSFPWNEDTRPSVESVAEFLQISADAIDTTDTHGNVVTARWNGTLYIMANVDREVAAVLQELRKDVSVDMNMEVAQ